MNKTGKRVLAGGVAVVLVASLAAGGVYLAGHRQRNPVNVYSIYDVGMTEYWGDSRQTSGMVTTDQMQNVYISTTQMVQEIYVQEGQNVRAGDLLLSYDTTLSTIELERKDLEIQKLQLSLKEAQENLKKIQSYRPGVPVDEKDLVSGNALGGSALGGDSLGSTAQSSSSQNGGSEGGASQTAGPQSGLAVASAAAGQLMADMSQNTLGNVAGMRLMSGLLLSASVDPTEPGTLAPMESTAESTDPSESPTASTEPTIAPTEPTAAPTEPTVAPTDPATEPTIAPMEPTVAPTDPAVEPEDPAANPTAPSAEPIEPTEPAASWPEPVRGDGTLENPYLYLWRSDLSYTPAFLEQLLGEKEEVWATFMLRENDSLEGLPLSSWTMAFARSEAGIQFEMLSVAGPEEDPLVLPEDPGITDPGIMDPGLLDPGMDVPSGPTYTAAEIAQMKSDQEMAIRDINLNIRVAQVEYEKLEKELYNSEVRAEVDGVVKSVGDPDTAAVENKPLITVSGGDGGYHVQGRVSELDLKTVQPGQPVTVMSWMTGETAEGTIQEIGDMPASENYWDGTGNPNSSYYPFTVFVDDSATFENGDYLDITYTPQSPSGDGNSVYLQNPFVRSEDGQSYVYVKGTDGKLEKRQVVVGKSLYGSYTEIRSGLTAEDRVAFPYGKDVKAGSPTRDGTMEELYSTMGY